MSAEMNDPGYAFAVEKNAELIEQNRLLRDLLLNAPRDNWAGWFLQKVDNVLANEILPITPPSDKQADATLVEKLMATKYTQPIGHLVWYNQAITDAIEIIRQHQSTKPVSLKKCIEAAKKVMGFSVTITSMHSGKITEEDMSEKFVTAVLDAAEVIYDR